MLPVVLAVTSSPRWLITEYCRLFVDMMKNALPVLEQQHVHYVLFARYVLLYPPPPSFPFPLHMELKNN